MGDARTDKTGHSKLLTLHAIHVKVEEVEYEQFRKWCEKYNTTPTTHLRAMIKAHNAAHAGEVP